MANWQKVGVVGVDAGLLWLGDPCYVLPDDALDNPGKDWLKFCNKLEKDTTQWNYLLGHPGLGVSVSTGYGDEVYDVFVQKTENGRIKAVKVVFIEEEE